MKTLLTFIFENINIDKVRLSTFSFNKRATNPYKKYRFNIDDVLKDEIFKDRKYYNKIVVSIFRN